MKYLVDIEGYNAGDVTLHYATHGMWDGVTYYEPRLSNPGNFERHMFAAGTTSGESQVGFGEVVLRNEDGELDHLRSWGFAGRLVTIRKTETTAAAATTTFVGTLEQPAVTWDDVAFRMRDGLEALRRPLQTNLYSGVTVSGGRTDAEGRPDDLKDRPKPLIYGRVLNVPAVPANVFDLVYQVNDGAVHTVDAVYDKGVALAQGSDFATLADLIASTPAPGGFNTCLAQGYFMLGSSPVGQITADVTEGATLADRTAAQASLRVLAKAQITNVDSASAAAVDVLDSSEIGIWVPDGRATLSVLSEMLGSIGAWLAPTRLGVLQFGLFAEPAAPAKLSIYQWGMPDGIKLAPGLPSDENRGVPAWQVNVRHKKNWTVQNGAAVVEGPCANQERRAFLDNEWREVKSEDASIKVSHPLAVKLTFDTLLLNAADAEAQAARRLALHSVPRAVFNIPVSAEKAAAVDLGDVISLNINRFGCDLGKKLVVIGIVEDYATNSGTIIGWGAA